MVETVRDRARGFRSRECAKSCRAPNFHENSFHTNGLQIAPDTRARIVGLCDKADKTLQNRQNRDPCARDPHHEVTLSPAACRGSENS
jgi:hypothetical protein